MRKLLTASKDTTLYQALSSTNAGLDEILDIGKVLDDSTVPDTDAYVSASARTLIHFNVPDVGTTSPSASYYLNLRLANAEKLKRNQTLLVYLVSSSWDEGSGYLVQQPNNVSDGATWVSGSVDTAWASVGGDFLTSNTSQSITLSQFPLEDLRIDVTSILQPIVSESLQNTFYGFALQFPVADELDDTNEGILKVFSTQTHTVHQPTLEVAWDDQIFSTGSLLPIPSLNVRIAPSNIRDTYTKGDVDRIQLVVRDQFPLKSFDSILRYKNKYYLPQTSYYSIVDTQSNTTIVPFDDFSKISTDVEGSYVVLDTSPLYRGRYYTLKLKVANGAYSRVVETETTFRIN